ncbi:hypothetical protein QG37_01952 [Candidozyma auris]|uniref:Uncharacterized protein n=1 Tax=Candidozyma auris TaxID=498019 RepID=A0A0L0P452_CANAR|nr:hypothetical protein QG37_01952 [[Candida] auris]
MWQLEGWQNRALVGRVDVGIKRWAAFLRSGVAALYSSRAAAVAAPKE